MKNLEASVIDVLIFCYISIFELQMHKWLPSTGWIQLQILQKTLTAKHLQLSELHKAAGARDPKKPRGHIVQVCSGLVLSECCIISILCFSLGTLH